VSGCICSSVFLKLFLSSSHKTRYNRYTYDVFVQVHPYPLDNYHLSWALSSLPENDENECNSCFKEIFSKCRWIKVEKLKEKTLEDK
jgi:hypothetical protein